MEDGIFPTDVPHLYRVHSSSGAVEYRLVDVAACLCSCPNDGWMCSHRYAVVVAMPQYSVRFGLVLMVRLFCLYSSPCALCSLSRRGSDVPAGVVDS
jgi:hypothetical protein